MKKMVCLLALILILGGFACAESYSIIMKDTPVSIDLDGDGGMEIVEWTMEELDGYDPCLAVTVTDADGASMIYETYITWSEEVYAADLNSDGMTEILVTGDIMSDDYTTYCLRYDGNMLYELLFADANRGENTDGYYKSGYGRIVEIGNGTLTLMGSQDVLGTWMATREFTLAPNGRFELYDIGIWQREVDFSNTEIWEYGALTLKTNLDVMLTDGMNTYNAVLRPGDRIVITASDKEERVWFMNEDGMEGILSISENYETGWGHLVNDIPEDELFEYVPYAD